jgi:hypothetical protein
LLAGDGWGKATAKSGWLVGVTKRGLTFVGREAGDLSSAKFGISAQQERQNQYGDPW